MPENIDADERDNNPQFVTVMRGYDRAQVDDYIENLTTWLDESTERARLAEAATAANSAECSRMRDLIANLQSQLAEGPPRSVDQLADRINGMLGEASRMGEAIREAAEADADAVRHEATTLRAEAEQARADSVREREEAQRWAAEARALAEAESGERTRRLIAEAEQRAAEIISAAEAAAAAAVARAADDVRRLRSARDIVEKDVRRLGAAISEALQITDGDADVVDIRDSRAMAPESA